MLHAINDDYEGRELAWHGLAWAKEHIASNECDGIGYLCKKASNPKEQSYVVFEC